MLLKACIYRNPVKHKFCIHNVSMFLPGNNSMAEEATCHLSGSSVIEHFVSQISEFKAEAQ